MSHEFRPGHPVLFWIFILATVFVLYSGAKAVMTIDECEGTGGERSWQVWPPGWECRLPPPPDFG